MLPDWLTAENVLIALIGAIGAYFTQRAAAKANSRDKQETTKADAEKEAYNRALAFDKGTIEAQNKKIAELEAESERRKEETEQLREDNRHLNNDVKMVAQDNRDLHHENSQLRDEIAELHRVIENLRSYIHHDKGGSQHAPEEEVGVNYGDD